MNRIHYVYVLQRRDKTGNFCYEDLEFKYEPFYVGKGSRKEIDGKIIYDRLLHTVTSGNSHKMNVIKKLDREVEITLFYFDAEEEAFDTETVFIHKIGRKDLGKGPLTNYCDGGRMKVDGKSHYKRTAQYDKQGKLVKVFISSNHAISETKISNISRAAKNKILAGGFFWRIFDNDEIVSETIEIGDYFEKRMHNGNIPRSVLAYSETEQITFASIKEASIFTKVGSPTICRACLNNKIYNGFKFKYLS